MDVTLDLEERELTIRRSAFDDSKVELSDRQDRETVAKTMSLPIHNPNVSTTAAPLTDRVTVENKEQLMKEIDEVVPELMTALEELNNGVEPDPNFVLRIQDLVARVLTLLNRIGEKDRAQLKQLEAEYRKATLDAAEIQRGLGSHDLKVAAASFAVSLLGLASMGRSEIAMRADQPFVENIAKQIIPGIGNLFSAPKQAEMTRLNSKSSLDLQRYSAQTNKGSSDASNKQEMTALIDKALRILEAASKNG